MATAGERREDGKCVMNDDYHSSRLRESRPYSLEELHKYHPSKLDRDSQAARRIGKWQIQAVARRSTQIARPSRRRDPECSYVYEMGGWKIGFSGNITSVTTTAANRKRHRIVSKWSSVVCEAQEVRGLTGWARMTLHWNAPVQGLTGLDSYINI
jgi:hypothetical protein